jgi:hypothetical protein
MICFARIRLPRGGNFDSLQIRECAERTPTVASRRLAHGVRTPTVASRRLASEVFLTENSVCVFAIAILAALRARRATSTSKRAYVRREGYYRGWTLSKECRIIKAKRLDPGQLTQLQRLRKRLKEHDGYAHKVDFALNPQERRGRLYPKRGALFLSILTLNHVNSRSDWGRTVANFSRGTAQSFTSERLFVVARRRRAPRRCVTNQSRETGDVPFAHRKTTRK